MEVQKQRWLVTGGAGFIGSNIVRRLVDDGVKVRVLDNLETGCIDNISDLYVDFIEGDICDVGDCWKACEDVDVVLHQAALPSVPRSMKHPNDTYHNCVTGTFNMLRMALAAGVKRFVYAASSSAYGDALFIPSAERQKPAPISPYAAAKLCGEYWTSVYCSAFELDTISLRYFNVYGPRQNPHSQYANVVPAFITALLNGEQPVIYGDGSQRRDYTYVENVVNANILAGMKPGVLSGEVVNIGSNNDVTVTSLLAFIQKILGTNVAPRYAPERKGDVQRTCADITLANEHLGYNPDIDIFEGLEKTIDWIMSNRKRKS